MPIPQLTLIVIDPAHHLGVTIDQLAQQPVYSVQVFPELLTVLDAIDTGDLWADVLLMDEQTVMGSYPADTERHSSYQRLIKLENRTPPIDVLLLTNWETLEIPARAGGRFTLVRKPILLPELLYALEHLYQERKQSQTLKTLVAISSLLNSERQIQEILTLTCMAVVQLFDVDHSGFVYFESDQSHGWPFAEYPSDRAVSTMGSVIPVIGVPVEERLVFEKEIVHIPNVRLEEGLGEVRGHLLNAGIESILLVPVEVHGKVVASFSLDAIGHRRVFTEEETRLARNLADQVATGIGNVHFRDEADQARRYLRAVFDAGRAIGAARDLKQLLQSIVIEVCTAAQAWRAHILMMNEAGQVTDYATAGAYNAPERVTHLRPDGISLQVLAEGNRRIALHSMSERSVVRVDLGRFFGRASGETEQLHPEMRAVGVRSAACLPLPGEERAIGVLWVQYREEHEFSDTEKDALRIFADLVGKEYLKLENELAMLQAVSASFAQVDQPSGARVSTPMEKLLSGGRIWLGADRLLVWPYAPSEGVFTTSHLIAVPTEQDEELVNLIPLGQHAAHFTDEYTHFNGEYTFGDKRFREVTDIEVDSLDWPPVPMRTALRQAGVRALQVIRLEVENELQGVLIVLFNRPIGESTHERGRSLSTPARLNLFAAMLAQVIKLPTSLAQAKRYWEASRQVSELSVQAIASPGTLKETLLGIVQIAKEQLGCDTANLYVFDESRQAGEDTGSFIKGVGYGNSDQANLDEPETLKPESSPWRIINHQGEMVYCVTDVRSDPILWGGYTQKEEIVSAAGLKLMYANRRVGVVFFNYKRRHLFSAEERNYLAQFGYQAALTIESAMQFERAQQLRWQAERSAEALEALHTAGQTVEQMGNLAYALETVCQQALQVIGNTDQQRGCISHLALRTGNMLAFAAASPREKLSALSAKIGTIDLAGLKPVGIVGRAVLDQVSLNVPDALGHPDYLPYADDIRSQISIPLFHHQQVIGVLSVESPQFAFGPEDQHALEALAVQASVAIQKAHLLYLLQGLLDAGQVITDGQPIDLVLTKMAATFREVFACDLVSIYTYNHHTSELSYPAFYAGEAMDRSRLYKGELVNKSRRIHVDHLDKSSIKSLLDHGTHIFASQVQADPILGSGNFVWREHIQSSAGLLLKIRSDIVGLVFLNYRQPHEFSRDEKNEIALLANYAAVAIEVARKYDELRETNAWIGGHTALAWMSLLRKAWLHTVISTGNNVEKSVAAMRALLESEDVLREAGSDFPALKKREAFEEQFAILQQEAHRLSETPITPPYELSTALGPLSVQNLLRDRVKYLQQAYPHKFSGVKIEFAFPEQTETLTANQDWFSFALDRVIDNALRAMAGLPEQVLHLGLRRLENLLEIRVEDSGRGIPAEIRDKILMQPLKGTQGLGIGLMLVRAIIETYGGEVLPPEDLLPQGTAFIFRFPVGAEQFSSDGDFPSR